jgi:hypothetical protein
MKAMLGISCIVILNSISKNALSYYAYVFFSTKLEIRAQQVLPGSKRGGVGGEGRGWEGRQRTEMTQTMYAHVSMKNN